MSQSNEHSRKRRPVPQASPSSDFDFAASGQRVFEIERDGHASQVGGYADGIANLRKVAAQHETTIKRLKQQVDTVRATESVQRAQVAVAQRREGSDVRVRTALDSLERIKQQQAERGARLQSAAEISRDGSEDVLDAKLRAAGITPQQGSAQTVLERLKAQQQAKSA